MPSDYIESAAELARENGVYDEDDHRKFRDSLRRARLKGELPWCSTRRSGDRYRVERGGEAHRDMLRILRSTFSK